MDMVRPLRYERPHLNACFVCRRSVIREVEVPVLVEADVKELVLVASLKGKGDP